MHWQSKVAIYHSYTIQWFSYFMALNSCDKSRKQLPSGGISYVYAKSYEHSKFTNLSSYVYSVI